MKHDSFKYTADMVDCTLCTGYDDGCKHRICPWLAERFEADCVSYEEALLSIYKDYPSLLQRINRLVQSFPGTIVIPTHKERTEILQALENDQITDGAFAIISHGMLIAKYGLPALRITMKTKEDILNMYLEMNMERYGGEDCADPE